MDQDAGHQKYTVCPIGAVSTPFEGIGDPPRQEFRRNAVGELTVEDQYAGGPKGLTVGDSIDVIWFAHRSKRDILRARDRGVFSTRSPERPNPICVMRCTIEAIDDRRLAFRGVDMVNGTPVLDLEAPID